MTTKFSEVDVLIIGAGPAGATAAAYLQREGFRLLVVEKEVFPRFIIGESMLPSSMNLLEEAGFLPALEARNFMRKTGAVFLRGNQTCRFDFSDQFTTGWKYTYQVTRAEFDKTLADSVAERGVEILYGHSVTAVEFTDSRAAVTIQSSDKTSHTVTAKFVLDCSGFGRVLPRLLQLEKPSQLPAREALFTHVTGDVRPEGIEEGKIWVCIHPDDAWTWIIPFSNGRTSVGIVAEPKFFARYPGTPEEQFRAIVMSDPNSAARLGAMEIVFTPRRVQGFACGVTKLFGPQFALVGNATEFIDPIFSSGVTLALESARRSAQVLTRHLRGEPVDWQTEYADHVMQGINTFRSYVMAWYNEDLQRIFFAPQRNPAIMKQICSVLAGYVWDKANPYVAQPERGLALLAKIAARQESPIS